MSAVPSGGRRSLVVGLSCVVHFGSVRTGPPGGRSMPADPDLRVKLAVYRHFAETGRRPQPEEVARRAGLDTAGGAAARHRPGRVHSRCEEPGEPLVLEVGIDGPEPSTWLFHCLVPASQWWDDLVFTWANMLFFRSEEKVRAW